MAVFVKPQPPIIKIKFAFSEIELSRRFFFQATSLLSVIVLCTISLFLLHSMLDAKSRVQFLAAQSYGYLNPVVTRAPPVPHPSIVAQLFQQKVLSANDDSNVISFSNDFTFPLLRSKGYIYIDEGSPYNRIPDPSLMTWNVIATASAGTQDDTFRELYSFKRFNLANDGKTLGLAFVMRWDFAHYDVYLYRNDDLYGNAAGKILSFVSPLRDQGIDIPRIDQVSSDGKFVALDMYPCSSCGRGNGSDDTLLLDVDTGIKKRIGKISYFKWKDDGSYEYKIYRELPCSIPEGETGYCPVDTSVKVSTGKI